jgi:protein-S-isoprenylcysteine O-methyltransferase Ste14
MPQVFRASPFRASAFEYKFRFILHGVIFLLGFYAPWMYWGRLHLTDQSTWLVLSHQLTQIGAQASGQTAGQPGPVGFVTATEIVLALALLLIGLGAALRVWGTAYVSAGVVHSRGMHGGAMLADGPYRRTRNPLYLGTLLHTLGLAILMRPSAAILVIALIWVLQIRLALAEEPFLAERFGAPYLEYMARVPRFIPSVTPRVPAAGARPHWLQAFGGELYFCGVFVTFAVLGWSFNATWLKQGVLISLGAWLVVRAFLPRPKTS